MKTIRSRANIQDTGGCRAWARIRAMAAGVRLSGILMARDTAGAVLIWVALGTPVFLGLAGLGLDASMWFMERRVMQSAADMAAIAATNALSNGGNQAALQAAADHILSENGFALTAADNFEVRSPPLGGPNTGNASAVEIVLRRPGNRYLVTQFIDAVSIQTRAVGLMRFSGELCIIALDETADAAVEFKGTASGNVNCGVASRSNSDTSIHVGGTSSINVTSAHAYGDIFLEGTATLGNDVPLQTYAPMMSDPFGPEGRDLQLPLLATCDPAPTFGGPPGTTFEVDPGHYCGDFLIEHREVTFNPGTYIIEAGSLEIKAGSTVVGDGVTFILTASTPEDVGTILFTSDSSINFTAPTTGAYAGILIFEDPNAASYDSAGDPIQDLMVGGVNTNLSGAIYTPKREIRFAGGAVGVAQCLQLVGRKVTITGNAIIDNDPSVCETDIRQRWVRLVE